MDIHVPHSEHTDQIVDLWLDLAASQREHGSRILVRENANRIRKSILYHIANDTLLVATDQELRGFVMFSVESGGFLQDLTRGVIENLYVKPEFRSQGIGSQLLGRAEARLREEGVDSFTLEMLVQNERVREFYSRHGYVPHRLELEKSATD